MIRRLSFLAIVLGFSTFTFASSPKISVTDKTVTLVDLVLNWVPEPEFGGFYAADHLGFFEKNGLKVNIIPGGAGTPTVQMLAAGKAQFVITSGGELITARTKGADVVAVYNVYETSPMGLMTHVSQGHKDLQSLLKSEGTLAIQRGLAFVDFLERKFGFGKLKIVPYSGGVAQFVRDETFSQQGFIFSEPVMAKKLGAKPRFFLLSDIGYNPYIEVVAVRGETIEKQQDLVKSFVTSIKQGWEAYNKDPKATNEIMAKLNPAMDLAAMNEGAASQRPLIGDGSMNESRWKEQAALLLDLKNISKTVDTKTLFRNF
jgi:NitT/TauT family transport system substrate-binding protein